MKAVIIDDELKSIEVIRFLLGKYCPGVELAGDAGSVDAAIALINQKRPELIFLDVEMNEETGFDLLEQIPVRNFQVVFITAYSNYAVKAFRYSVADYLLKPVNIDELKNAVAKVQALLKLHAEAAGSKTAPHSTAMHTLRIPSGDGVKYIRFENIVRLEADGVYTHIHTDDGRRYTSSYNLKQYEEHLRSPLFMRIHRGDIINLDKVTSFTSRNATEVILAGGARIAVARRNRKEFLERMNSPLER